MRRDDHHPEPGRRVTLIQGDHRKRLHVRRMSAMTRAGGGYLVKCRALISTLGSKFEPSAVSVSFPQPLRHDPHLGLDCGSRVQA